MSRKPGSVNSTGDGVTSDALPVTGLLIGYARYSTDDQDLTAQHDAPIALGVPAEQVYVDHGLTGTTRARPGPGCARRWPHL